MMLANLYNLIACVHLLQGSATFAPGQSRARGELQILKPSLR